MNPDDIACETPLEDHIVCLIEYLRRPDARLSVEGKTWSACFGTGDVLNGMIADRLAIPAARASSGWKLVPIEPTPEMHDAGYAKSLGPPEPMHPDFVKLNAAIYRAMIAAAIPPAQSFDRIAVAELTKIAAECHRAKWEFDLSEDYTPSRALARTIIVNAFKALHRIGDQAMKAREAFSVTRPDRHVDEPGLAHPDNSDSPAWAVPSHDRKATP